MQHDRARPRRGSPWIGIVLALVLALVASACGRAASTGGAGGGPSPAATRAAFPITVTDDEGVKVTLARPPQRIVTFAPANTEIVFALGLGSRLVGVSGAYDDYPPAALKITRVGGAGQYGVDPNIEKVVSLHPALFLATSGGDAWKAKLRQLGIPVFTLNAQSFQGVLTDMQKVGELTGTEAAAGRLTTRMASEARAIQGKVATQPRVSCFFEVYYPPLYTVGPGSFVYGLLQMAGCDPVTASAKSPYPTWSVEELVKSGPQVYIIGSYPGLSVKKVEARPGFGSLPAVRSGHVFVVNSDLVTRPGPRIVLGLQELAQLLHPSAFGQG